MRCLHLHLLPCHFESVAAASGRLGTSVAGRLLYVFPGNVMGYGLKPPHILRLHLGYQAEHGGIQAELNEHKVMQEELNLADYLIW